MQFEEVCCLFLFFFLVLVLGSNLLFFFFFFCLLSSPEKLIEGLKSPDTSSLLLPDLLSLSDPFGGSVEEAAKGVCVCVCERFFWLI